jgi:hypothetical protein
MWLPLACALLSASGFAFAQHVPHFTDVSAATGMWRVPTAWGVTAEDVDGDGDLDLLMANNGSENAVFYNEGGLRFWGQPIIGGAPGTEALVPGDVNGDGRLDLLACVWGGPSTLFLGDGTGWFTDASEAAGLPPIPDGRCGGAALGDVDGDGDLDLYLPDGQKGDRLLVNQDGYFTDVTQATRLSNVPGSEAALMADFDDDGRLDIYVPRYDGSTALYLNHGGGRLADLAATTNAFAAPSQLGACAFDADGDGDLDLLCVGGRFNDGGAPLRLLTNLGGGEFVDSTPAAWAAQPQRHHSACVGDVDNDGDLDVFVCTLGGCSLWLNDGEGQFARVTDEPGWGTLPGAGAVLCDLDGDGDLDVLLRARPTDIDVFGEFLFRNDVNDANWLEVRPISATGSRFCHGAQVRVYRAGGLGNTQQLVARRDLTSLCGWGSYLPFVAHFGVDSARTYDVEVRFTDGSRGVAEGVEAGRYIEVQAQPR